jgi:hypothetical protein
MAEQGPASGHVCFCLAGISHNLSRSVSGSSGGRTKRDELGIRVGREELALLLVDHWEQVASAELGEVLVPRNLDRHLRRWRGSRGKCG